MDVARVVLALEEHDVAEEVMHFLDRSGRARVVAMAGDDRQLAEAVRQLEPDAVVAQPGLVRPGALNGSALIAIETRETVGALRAAIAAGARGFFVWPAERELLVGATAAAATASEPGAKRAFVVAVWGPRGGSGATFVATHLAAAFARGKRECVLVDADPSYADVTAALGAFPEGEGPAPRTIADLAPLEEELDAARLDEVLWTHPDGFRVLLAPEAPMAGIVGPRLLRRAIDEAARSADVVLTHLPRTIDEGMRVCVEPADRVLLVLSLDVLSFRAGRRALEQMPEAALDIVVNRAARAEVTPSDVVRVFGREPIAVLPSDARVTRAQDHGRLVPARSRLGRAFDRLASRLVEEDQG
ncbi:MAG: hypothetical protein HY240_06300 [Actinobacteria bacterium]|nr:hypothetical protein [Actinomycetota bacterium]